MEVAVSGHDHGIMLWVFHLVLRILLVEFNFIVCLSAICKYYFRLKVYLIFVMVMIAGRVSRLCGIFGIGLQAMEAILDYKGQYLRVF